MIPEGFTELLNGPLSSRLVWESAHRCPCANREGQADQSCGICLGEGWYHDAPSQVFQAGLTGLSADALQALRQKLGQSVSGDAVLSLPVNAPAYDTAGAKHRFIAADAIDSLEWVISPGAPVRLPWGAKIITAWSRNAGKTALVRVAPPVVADGLVSVASTVVLRFRAPRRFEVVEQLAQVRSFSGGEGLPKKFLLKLVDATVRS